MKKPQRTAIISIILHVVSLFLLNFFTFTISKNTHTKQLHDNIKISIQKRIQDYEKIFQFILENQDIQEISKKTKLLSNKKIYLNKNIPIDIGEFNLDTSHKKNYKKLNRALILKPFFETSLTDEPLTDIKYSFNTKDNRIISLSTTILLKDLLIYASEQDNISISESKCESSIYIDDISSYITIKSNLFFTKLFYLLLIINLMYVLIFFIMFLLKNTKKEKNNSLNLQELEQQNIEYNKKIELLLKIIACDTSKTENSVSPTHVIRNIVSTYGKKLSEKKINFSIEYISIDIILNGNKKDWYILLLYVVDILIEEVPPNSKITFSVKIDSSIVTLAFTDNIPVRLKLDKRINMESKHSTFVPDCNVEFLSKKLNLFLNCSFSNEHGNSLFIAVPYEQPKPCNQKKSNVFSIVR